MSRQLEPLLWQFAAAGPTDERLPFLTKIAAADMDENALRALAPSRDRSRYADSRKSDRSPGHARAAALDRSAHRSAAALRLRGFSRSSSRR